MSTTDPAKLDRFLELVARIPGVTTGQVAEFLRCSQMSVKRYGLELHLVRKTGPVPGQRGITTRWYPPEEPGTDPDAARQLDVIDEWLNARGVPEVGDTAERVVFALGRCWEAR